MLALFRRPTDQDEEFLHGLARLEEEVGVLAATAASLYRSRGTFVVLDPSGEQTLEALHRALEDFLAAPEPFLAAGGERGRVWAQLLFDTRSRIRAEILAGWREDVHDVRSGLALLRANTDGWVRFDDEEARLVARRVDLAGALSRARVKDLTALREAAGQPSEVRAEDVDRLLAIVAEPPGPGRQERLDGVLLSAELQVRSMRELLFTTRLREAADEWIRWGAGLESKAERLAGEVRAWRPDTQEGRDAPRAIRSKKKTRRRREAYARAVAGLRLDPFDEELAYAAGLMAEYVAGTLEALDYYDRFLTLRGIRVHDDRNWRGRELTPEESHALFQIQQFESELGKGGGEEGG